MINAQVKEEDGSYRLPTYLEFSTTEDPDTWPCKERCPAWEECHFVKKARIRLQSER